MRPRLTFLLAATVALAALAGVAAGKEGKHKQVRFVGIHPIAKGHGTGLCHIEVPHVHVYAPADPVQYRDYDHGHFFVGDPVAYGWEGDKHSYYGHHPIYVSSVVDAEVAVDPVYCYLDGPHYHYYKPPLTVAADFELEADAYFYVGEPLPVYVEQRPAMVKINAIYTPIEYTRPVVTVEPPAAWIGIRFAVPAAVVVEPAPAVVVEERAKVRAGVGVEVHAPAVEVHAPSVEIDVGIGIGVGGGVAIGGGGHGHHHKGKGKGKAVKVKSKGKKGKGGGGGGVIFGPNRR
jgi:hypothetical protein